MRRITIIVLPFVAFILAACPNRNQANCEQHTDCDRVAGGECLLDPVTGGQWCSYPAAECDSGRRWEEPDTDPRIAGACVILDEEVDAAQPDGPPADARIDGSPDAAGVVQWARAFGGTGNDPIRDIAVTADESVLIVGAFEASVGFGGNSFTSLGGSDAFVAKLSATGQHVWSKQYGGGSNDSAYAVALDAAGDVYVIGTFQGTVDFDGQSLTAGGAADEFLIKLDGDTGARVWAVKLGYPLTDRQDLAVSADGQAIAVVGAFYGTINLGGSNLTAVGADVAVAKYNSTGGHIWSRGFGGTGTDRGYAVALLANGDVAIAGTYRGPANFGGAQQLAAAGTGTAGDAFIARYASANGAYVWANGYGGNDPSAEELFTIAADASAIYVGGHFGGSASFGGSLLMANGSDDAVLAKYDATTGSHIWSKRFGGPSYETIQRLALDNGEVWFSGYFSGQTTVGATVLDSAGIADVVYGRAAVGTGDFLGAGSVGGQGTESAAGIGVSAGNVWVAGTFTTGFAMFGATLSPVAMTDMFVGRTQR
ncbi:MAG: hypothetical protein HS111_16950 [Kofleriaceae bacterium]|nr:hypothetical protein [Kofleriaceae bacterium]MCL4223141.1 hypothetical protein [Myxococcales bacterium]